MVSAVPSSEKRARQKAGRQERLEAERQRAKRNKQLRRGAIIAVVVVVIVGLIYFIQHKSNKSNNASKTTTTVKAATTTTSSSSSNKSPQAKANALAVAAGCPANPSTQVNTLSWPSAPAMTIDTSKTYVATVKTTAGTFTINLDAAKTPQTVNNFVFLAQKGYYHCVIFHRVIPGFMDQTGDPTGTGTGGASSTSKGQPGYTIPDELPATANPQYPIGSVAMANTGAANSGGSQFFIVTGSEGESLPATYTLFGQVPSTDMAVPNLINSQGTAGSGVPPKVTQRILSVTITSS
jgi:cyclophilin family peptidyl-prolyl cis-trans isomerase